MKLQIAAVHSSFIAFAMRLCLSTYCESTVKVTVKQLCRHFIAVHRFAQRFHKCFIFVSQLL